MELNAVFIISIAMLSIAIVSAVYTLRNSLNLRTVGSVRNTDFSFSNIKKGYAYTVDIGDSLIVVTVIEKSRGGEVLATEKQVIEVTEVVDK